MLRYPLILGVFLFISGDVPSQPPEWSPGQVLELVQFCVVHNIGHPEEDIVRFCSCIAEEVPKAVGYDELADQSVLVRPDLQKRLLEINAVCKSRLIPSSSEEVSL